MNGELDRLERAVEREMSLLRALPTVTPRPEAVAQVKAAVISEATRVSRSQRALQGARIGLAVAAAFLLAVGWVGQSPPRSAVAPSDSEAALRQWAAAWDESSHRLTRLLDAGIGGDYGGNNDENAELDEIFRSLEQSFSRFENL